MILVEKQSTARRLARLDDLTWASLKGKRVLGTISKVIFQGVNDHCGSPCRSLTSSP